ncbi:NAD-dependent epimerase/dehydratase family protein [Bacillus cereus]
MKMLVTGGTGFLGQKLAFRLKNMGYEVTATGRNKTIGKVLEQNGIEFVHCPLEDRERVVQVCKDKDYIFHSGALSSPWGKYEDFYNANVLGTKHIIEGKSKVWYKTPYPRINAKYLFLL